MPLLSYTVPQQPVLSQQSFFPQQSIIPQQSIVIQQSIINQPKTFSYIQFQSFNMRNTASLLALLTAIVPALTAPAVSEAPGQVHLQPIWHCSSWSLCIFQIMHARKASLALLQQAHENFTIFYPASVRLFSLLQFISVASRKPMKEPFIHVRTIVLPGKCAL